MLAGFLSGCFPAVVPYLEGDIKTEQSKDQEEVKWTRNESGKSYCSRVATTADSRSQMYLVAGVLTTLLASGAIITGTAMGPDTSDDSKWWEQNRNTLLLGTGTILAIPATMWLMRSRDASTASATASQAMGLDDDKAMIQCLQARADLVGARGALADVAIKDIAASGDLADWLNLRRLADDWKKAREEEAAATQALQEVPGDDARKQTEAKQAKEKAEARRARAETALREELSRQGIDLDRQ